MVISDYLSELERELGIQVSPHLPIPVRQDTVRDAIRNMKAAQPSVQADGWTRDENGVMERTISPDVQKKMPSRRQ